MPITDVVNNPAETQFEDDPRSSDLGSWCMHNLREWEDVRNTNYRTNWAQYERLWRGLWSSQDQQRKSERSKYISPALLHAVESVVAEIEEAIFSQGRFFDVDPEHPDQQNLMSLRDNLYKDLLEADIKSAISEAILNGAIYGTGIGKIVVEATKDKFITPKPVNGLPEVVEAGRQEDDKVVVRLVPVSPKEFVSDPAAKNITDALGCGHITITPLHIIEQRQRSGIYDNVTVSNYSGTLMGDETTGENKGITTNNAKIYEYHGLVPVDLLARYVLGDDYEAVVDPEEDLSEEEEMVEAIVTLTDASGILRAIPNPNTLQDRNFIAFQFDTVPNRFWGRGVCEKGFNAQMALDHEGRARQDGMALAIHPMMGIDATMMPRGADVRVRPGRSILTNGDPAQILKPLNFGQIGTDTFSQTTDLERQLSKATGAFDDSAVNANNAKTGAMGIAVSGAIKRSHRTLANIERNFIDPLIHKAAWRYMQYAPERYQAVENPQFNVQTTQGIVAKEWEVTNLGNMLKTVSPDSPAYWMLLKGIFQNSSIKNREEYDQVIAQQLEAAMNPQPTAMQQAQLQAEQAKLRIDHARARAELLRIEMEAQKLETGNLKTFSEAVLNIAKAESEEAGNDIAKYNAILGRIQAGLSAGQDKLALQKEVGDQAADVATNQ